MGKLPYSIFIVDIVKKYCLDCLRFLLFVLLEFLLLFLLWSVVWIFGFFGFCGLVVLILMWLLFWFCFFVFLGGWLLLKPLWEEVHQNLSDCIDVAAKMKGVCSNKPQFNVSYCQINNASFIQLIPIQSMILIINSE